VSIYRPSFVRCDSCAASHATSSESALQARIDAHTAGWATRTGSQVGIRGQRYVDYCPACATAQPKTSRRKTAK